MRPYRRAGGVTAGKTTTAGTVRRAGGRECTTSKFRRMRAVTRRHRIVAPHGERTKRAGMSTVIWVREVCGPSPLPTFRQRKRSQRTLKRAVLPRRLGALSLAQPAARRPRQRIKLPSVRKVVPGRPGSAGAPTAVFAQLSPSAPGGLDSVPLLTEWQLSTNSPASCLSITANGIGRDWIRRPSADRMNSSTDHRRPRN